VEAIEVHGHWWLLGHEATPIPGTLKIDESGGAQLTLIGTLRNLDDVGEKKTENGVTTTAITESALERSGTYRRIHGVAGVHSYTLEDCFQKRSTGFMGGTVPTEVVHVNQVFRNVHYEEDEDTVAIGVSFAPRFLSHWVRRDGLTQSLSQFSRESPEEAASHPSVSVHGYQLPSEDVTLPDGSQLHLRQRLTLSGNGIDSKSVQQLHYFRYDASELRHMQELLEVASDLQDLVSIATNRTAQFDEVNFYHPDIKFRPENETSGLKPISFFARWNAVSDSTKKPPLSLLFTFDDLGGMNGLASWMQVAARYRQSLGRVMATRYSTSMPVSDRLLNRAASLESFDRDRNGDSIDFGARMARCANYAGGQFNEMIKDRRKWSRMVRADRDDIAHNLGRSRETTEQYFLSESLYWLFVFCLLKECNAPHETFRSIKESRDFAWLCARVSALVAAS
jgi:hypothetical protein